jgi:outer membrane autotransporter protein
MEDLQLILVVIMPRKAKSSLELSNKACGPLSEVPQRAVPSAIMFAIGMGLYAQSANSEPIVLDGQAQSVTITETRSAAGDPAYFAKNGASITVTSGGILGNASTSPPVTQIANGAGSAVIVEGNGRINGAVKAENSALMLLGVGAASPAIVNIVSNGNVVSNITIDSDSAGIFDNVHIIADPSTNSLQGESRIAVRVTNGASLHTTANTVVDVVEAREGIAGTGFGTKVSIVGSKISAGGNGIHSLSSASFDITGAKVRGGAIGASTESTASTTLHGSDVRGGALVAPNTAHVAGAFLGVSLNHLHLEKKITKLTADQGSTITGEGNASGIKMLFAESNLEGQVHISDSKVVGARQGIEIVTFPAVTGRALVNLDHSQVSGAQSAILVDGNITADIRVRNDTKLIAGVGPILSASGGSQVNFEINGSHLEGDVVADSTSSGALQLVNNAALTGAVNRFDVDIDAGSGWAMTTSSAVGDLNLNGTVGFVTPTARLANPGRTLSVRNLAGAGGVVALNTSLNAGGPVSNQITDRLLVTGDVKTTSPTTLDVRPLGIGAATHKGRPAADKGISLVQVSGTSRQDAFQLKGGYVAAGPWKYRLVAFGPNAMHGPADPAQSVLPGSLAWDYRLAAEFVDETVVSGGGDKGPGVVTVRVIRPQVVPQLPGYLSLQTAMTDYLFDSTGSLHQRLGEIRYDSIASSEQYKSEGFVRLFGTSRKYHSDLGVDQFGNDFNSGYAGIQLGGNLYRNQNVNGTLRLGVAGIHSSGYVDTNTVDGRSNTLFEDYGVALIGTWQQASGLYVDAVLRGDRLLANVTTPIRGNVGNANGWGWVASVETGMPLMLTNALFLEPQAQLAWVGSNLHAFTDVDKVDVKFANQNNLIGRVGTRLGMNLMAGKVRYTPYVKANVLAGSGGHPEVVANNVSFESGRYGQAWQVGTGVDAKLDDRLDVVLVVNYQHSFAGSGFSGWYATGNFRWKF